jgi:hypothetical protein
MQAATHLSTQIRIVKPGVFKRDYEFYLDDTLKATLKYESAFKSKAIISINNHKWHICRTGFWKKQIELKADQSPYTKATIPSNWKYHISFRAANGNSYTFKPAGFWKRTWIWIDEQEQPVIEMKTTSPFSKGQGTVVLLQPATEELYLMMVFGWYQVIAYQRDAAAASG